MRYRCRWSNDNHHHHHDDHNHEKEKMAGTDECTSVQYSLGQCLVCHVIVLPFNSSQCWVYWSHIEVLPRQGLLSYTGYVMMTWRLTAAIFCVSVGLIRVIDLSVRLTISPVTNPPRIECRLIGPPWLQMAADAAPLISDFKGNNLNQLSCDS